MFLLENVNATPQGFLFLWPQLFASACRFIPTKEITLCLVSGYLENVSYVSTIRALFVEVGFWLSFLGEGRV
jgi:hypothetical protein